jgi:DNA-binding IscR family transcriptional regulator
MCNYFCCRLQTVDLGRNHGGGETEHHEANRMSANSQLTMAVHALCWLELASRRGRPSLTSAEVAASLANNPVQVRRSLGRLRDAGLVSVSGRGPGAGWVLTRPAEKISLSDVHTALGEPGPFALHPRDPNPECTVGAGIRPVLEAIYDDVQAAMDRQLRSTSIADVLEEILSNDRTVRTTDRWPASPRSLPRRGRAGPPVPR